MIDFHEVSEATYQGLLSTESPGGFYHARLKEQYITTTVPPHAPGHEGGRGETAHNPKPATQNAAEPNWIAAWEASIDLFLSNQR